MVDIRLSVAVMHVPGADPERNLLVRRLRNQFARVEVVRDLDRSGCWPTSLRAAKAIAPGATHHMVLQDHATVPDVGALHRAIEAAPEDWICPYVPRKELVEVEGNWAHSQGVWGTANVAPVQLWDEYRRWVTEWTMQAKTDHDDRRMSAWLMATGRTARIPVPNLVDHTGVKSLLGHSRAVSRSSRVLVTRDRAEPPVWGSPDGKNISTVAVKDVVKNVDPDKVDQWQLARVANL